MSCIWVFWLQILASLTVTQLSLRVYQETLVCQPGATPLPLEPIREGKASSPNLPDACSDVFSPCLMPPPSAAGRQSSRHESDQLQVFVWDGQLLTGPSQAIEGVSSLPCAHCYCTAAAATSAQVVGHLLCAPVQQRSGRDGAVRPSGGQGSAILWPC